MKNQRIFDYWKTERFDCLLNFVYENKKLKRLQFMSRSYINSEK